MTLAGSFLYHVCMVCFPLLHRDPDPKGINPQSQDNKQQPLDPHAKQTDRRTRKPHPPTVYDRMGNFPSQQHHDRPWITYPKCQNSNQKPKQAVTDQPKQTPIKIRFTHPTVSQPSGYVQHSPPFPNHPKHLPTGYKSPYDARFLSDQDHW